MRTAPVPWCRRISDHHLSGEKESVPPGYTLLNLNKRELSASSSRNPRPVFLTHNLRIKSEPRLIRANHLKTHIGGAAGRALETIWCNSADKEQRGDGQRPKNSMYDIATGADDAFQQLSVQEARLALG